MVGTFIDRLKRGREKLRLRISQGRERREIQSAISSEKFKTLRIEKERRRKVEMGFERLAEQKRMKERERSIELKAAKIIAKEERISKVREAQLKRARLEAGILKARAQRVKAIGQIRRPLPGLRLGGPILQPTQQMSGISLTSKKKKKIQGQTPGMGRFRVL